MYYDSDGEEPNVFSDAHYENYLKDLKLKLKRFYECDFEACEKTFQNH